MGENYHDAMSRYLISSFFSEDGASDVSAEEESDTCKLTRMHMEPTLPIHLKVINCINKYISFILTFQAIYRCDFYILALWCCSLKM